MKIIVTVMMTVLTFLCCPKVSVAGNESKRLLLEQYLDLMHYKETFEKQVHKTREENQRFIEELQACKDFQRMNAQDKLKGIDVIHRIQAIIETECNWEHVKNIILSNADDSFDGDELRAAVGFYSSPMGIKFEARRSVANDKMDSIYKEWSARLSTKLQGIFKELAPLIEKYNGENSILLGQR